MPGDLTGELISDYYTSLLHLSGSNVKEAYNNDSYSDIAINPIFDGAGNSTGIKLSAGSDPGSEDLSTDVIISNYIAPSANPYVGYSQLPNSSSMVLSPVAQAQLQLGIVGNDAVIYRDWLDTFYPIGSIQMTCNNDDPGNRIAGTKWVLVSQGQYPVGVGTGTDTNNISVTFSKENDQTADGDRLGEYGNRIQSDQLPSHSHNLNTQTTDVPGADASSINRLPYFGADPNPDGTENEDGELNGQSYINSFQTNEAGFRDTQVKGRNMAGYKYTDADFNPQLGGFSLKGWSWGSPSNESAGASVGVGWGGEDTSGVYVGGARPPGVDQGQSEVIKAADYDPRDSNLVHPGAIPDSSLVQIRNYLVSILGEDKAAAALEDVTLYRGIDGTDENVTPPRVRSYVTCSMPGTVNARSTSLGEGEPHNNIAPSFGLYIWKRVPDDYVAPEPPVITDDDDDDDEIKDTEEDVWEGIIDTNQQELNLVDWATGQGWNGNDKVKITIADGIYIYSDDAGPGDPKLTYDKQPAMQIDEFPNGLDLENNGFIMGRGGDGGYNYKGFRKSGGKYGVGQNGGDAIRVTSNSRIVINNNNGAIAGGGGGGGGSGTQGGGGGGGAGGGWGGTSISFNTETEAGNIGDGRRIPPPTKAKDAFMTSGGGNGGAPGQSGGNGEFYPASRNRGRSPGQGGQAGGSGAGGVKAGDPDFQGTGGGGGRVLSSTATGGVPVGGTGKSLGAGTGGGTNKDGTKAGERGGGGGGGWGAKGGSGGKSQPAGAGGFAIKRTKAVTRPDYWILGGLVYGESR